MKDRLIVIKCPRCDTEYLPAEIYLPNSFLGKPSGIYKVNGKIDWYSGLSMDTNESYVCDRCNCRFHVNAKVFFTTTSDDVTDFSTKTYKSKIKDEKSIFD